MNLPRVVLIGIIINTASGNYQNREHEIMDDEIQTVIQDYPIRGYIVIDEGFDGDTLRNKKNNTNRFISSIYNYFVGTTTRPPTTTPRKPDIFRIIYDLKSLLDNLESIAERIHYIIKYINGISRQELSRHVKIRYNIKNKRFKRENNNTDNISDAALNDTDKINKETNDAELKVNYSNELENGRRSNHVESSLVKAKLLEYLQEGFHDIQEKVKSLERLRQLYFNVVPYKVGYIVAHLDTLAVKMQNLREDVRTNQNLWGVREIFDVYERLKTSQNVVTNLLDTLRVFINSEY